MKKKVAKISLVLAVALAVVAFAQIRSSRASAKAVPASNNDIVIDVIEPTHCCCTESAASVEEASETNTTAHTETSVSSSSKTNSTLSQSALTSAPSAPVKREPEVTKPQVTEPTVTEPQVTKPQATEPQVTEPQVTEPADTTVAQPVETEHVHNYVAKNTVAANCTAAGYTTYACTSCDDAYNGDQVPPINHNYVDGFCRGCGEKDPTPTEPETLPEGEVCGVNCQHAEIQVGCYTYVYCSSVEAPYKSADGFVIYYPYSFYF